MGSAQRNNPFNKMRRANPAAGPDRSTVYDAMGRVVEAGDMVMFSGYPGLRWRVAACKPVLHPQAPPGLIEITFTAIMVEPYEGGKAHPALIKIADYSEMQDYTPEKAKEYGRTLEPVEDIPHDANQQDPGDSPTESGPQIIVPGS